MNEKRQNTNVLGDTVFCLFQCLLCLTFCMDKYTISSLLSKHNDTGCDRE